jgi:hypothetical protein
MISPNMYANVPGMGYLGLPGVQQAASFAGKAVDAAAKAPGAARIAGSVGLKGLGAATKFLGPIGLATTAVGGVLNAGNRMMKGENPVTAVTNAAYDTADFAAFGLLKPAVGMIQGAGESLGKAVFGQSPEDAMNEANTNYMKAQAEGNPGSMAAAQQQMQQAQQQIQSGAQRYDSSAPVSSDGGNQADMNMGRLNSMYRNDLGNQQLSADQDFRNQNRQAESNFDRQRRAANIALNNSYYAKASEMGQTMGRDSLQGLIQLGQLGQQGVTQAMTMRY